MKWVKIKLDSVRLLSKMEVQFLQSVKDSIKAPINTQKGYDVMGINKDLATTIKKTLESYKSKVFALCSFASIDSILKRTLSQHYPPSLEHQLTLDSMAALPGLVSILARIDLRDVPGPEQKNWTWEEYYFSHMPLAAQFANLTKIQNDVREIEGNIIQMLSGPLMINQENDSIH
jgi:hypothetical protein